MAVRKREFKTETEWFVDKTLPNGKRIRKVVGTKKQTEKIDRQIDAEIVEGTWGIRESEDISFSSLAVEYLDYAKANKAENTYDSDRCRIELHLLPYFKDTTLKRITPQMVDSYKQLRVAEGASNNTVNHELTNLSHMLKMAIRWCYLDRNVVSVVDRMKVPKKSPRFLSQEEIRCLVEAAIGSHIYPLIMTALHTGMGKSELFNLQWSDIDFDQGTVTLNPKEDWHTKNYRPRTLQLTPALYDVLMEHRQLCFARGIDSSYVFTYKGRRFTSNIKNSLSTVVRKSGLEKVTLHTLRHTFASQLAMAGVPLREIQELMGHQSFETTLQYAHLSQDHAKKQVNKLPFANGLGNSKARVGHAEVLFIDSPKKKEPGKGSSLQGS